MVRLFECYYSCLRGSLELLPGSLCYISYVNVADSLIHVHPEAVVIYRGLLSSANGFVILVAAFRKFSAPLVNTNSHKFPRRPSSTTS